MTTSLRTQLLSRLGRKIDSPNLMLDATLIDFRCAIDDKHGTALCVLPHNAHTPYVVWTCYVSPNDGNLAFDTGSYRNLLSEAVERLAERSARSI